MSRMTNRTTANVGMDRSFLSVFKVLLNYVVYTSLNTARLVPRISLTIQCGGDIFQSSCVRRTSNRRGLEFEDEYYQGGTPSGVDE